MPIYDDTPLISSSPFRVTPGGNADIPINLDDKTVSPLMTFSGCVYGPAFPVCFAHVGVFDTDFTLKADTQADIEGNYTMSAELRTGNYYLAAAASGYVFSGYTPINIYGQNLCVFDFFLTPKAENGGGLYGVVKGIDGTAISNARISLYDAVTRLYAAGGISNKDGSYEINNLKATCYYVTALAAGYNTLRPFSVIVTPLQKQQLDLTLKAKI